jgi:putative endonuclease
MVERAARVRKSRNRSIAGYAAFGWGLEAEFRAAAALEADGWGILARRQRTPSGEIDLIARKGGLIAFVEVKARTSLRDAASALSRAQIKRLMAAAAWSLPQLDPSGACTARFDVILVDRAGTVRRVCDAFRAEHP